MSSTLQTSSLNRSWALLFARLVLGLIFFMAGVWKVFQLGPLNHARKYFLPFADTFLPVWSLWATGVVIPFIELIGGALVILGLRTRRGSDCAWIRAGDRDLRAFIERTALRISHTRNSQTRPTLVCIHAPA